MSSPHDGPTVLTVTSPGCSPAASASVSPALAPSATLSMRPDTRSTRPPSAVVASWIFSAALAPKGANASLACSSVNVVEGISQMDPPSKSMLRLRPRVNNDAREMITSTVETMPTRHQSRGKLKSFVPR